MRILGFLLIALCFASIEAHVTDFSDYVCPRPKNFTNCRQDCKSDADCRPSDPATGTFCCMEGCGHVCTKLEKGPGDDECNGLNCPDDTLCISYRPLTCQSDRCRLEQACIPPNSANCSNAQCNTPYCHMHEVTQAPTTISGYPTGTLSPCSTLDKCSDPACFKEGDPKSICYIVPMCEAETPTVSTTTTGTMPTKTVV